MSRAIYELIRNISNSATSKMYFFFLRKGFCQRILGRKRFRVNLALGKKKNLPKSDTNLKEAATFNQ